MKSIEEKSNLLIEQISFAKYFLKMLNVNIKDKMNVDRELEDFYYPFEEKIFS